MRTSAWSVTIVFLILLGLAAYLALVLPGTADDPWPEASIAGYVAIGCAVAAAIALTIGVLLLRRRRRR
jgi:hypothetical protein